MIQLTKRLLEDDDGSRERSNLLVHFTSLTHSTHTPPHTSIHSHSHNTVTISPYFTGDNVNTSIEFGLYDHFQTVASNKDLCSKFYPVANDDAVSCPSPGTYSVETYFTVPTISDYSFHYTPDIRLSFYDSSGNRLGCGTTGTVALHRTADDKAVKGIWALGISCIAFCLVFSVLLYLSYRRKKRLEQLQLTERKSNSSNGNNRYQYFRTLPNGQVIPLAGRVSSASHPRRNPPLVRVSSSGSMSVARATGDGHDKRQHQQQRQISNPSYNETQLPTRPII